LNSQISQICSALCLGISKENPKIAIPKGQNVEAAMQGVQIITSLLNVNFFLSFIVIFKGEK